MEQLHRSFLFLLENIPVNKFSNKSKLDTRELFIKDVYKRRLILAPRS